MMKHLFSSLVIAVLMLSPGLAAQAAGSASMGLDQSVYEVARGDFFDVTVSLDPGGASIDTARAVVTYDPTIVRAQSVRLVGELDRSAPGNYLDNQIGKVSWGAFTLGTPVSAQTDFISITFLVLQTGNASIKISADSRAIQNGEEQIDTTTLGEATIEAAEATQADPGVALVVVESSSHEDEDQWYSNADVELSWTELEGDSPIEAYYYSLGLASDEEPNIYLVGSTHELSLDAEEDGLYYFRIKGVQEDGRETPEALRMVRVDTIDPNPIELIAQDDKIIEGESVWFTFATTDETSGVIQYQIAINDSEFQIQTSPLEMEDLKAGTYFFRVAAFDRAGNSSYGGVSVRVYPEGTDLDRPEGYERSSEVAAIASALSGAVTQVTKDRTLLITIVLGVLILFGIIYSTRKRKK